MEPSFHLGIIDDDEIYGYATIQYVNFLGLMVHKGSVYSNGDALSFISENLDKPILRLLTIFSSHYIVMYPKASLRSLVKPEIK
ncbi:hypothetical protein SAMN05421766_103748 [Zobellia uliginosa]|uniref:Uncharacterized protein n=1 Tax=Zobellia uliginosa TaxID=143224 RepID=A0ABY1KTI7_9FLAO|nr:hypothetical protein SAMN05421766_103748 [Zobellia uliginosa]